MDSGVVYVADSQRVHAISLRDGSIRWESDTLPVTPLETYYETQDTVSPAVGPNGRVFVGTSMGLTALDGDDGSELWSVSGLSNVAAPTVGDDAVFAVGENSIVALDFDGTERWRRDIDRMPEAQPAAVSAAILAVQVEEGLTAFDPETGDQLWYSNQRVETYPVVAGDTVYVGNYEGLHALSIANGAGRWTYERGGGRTLLSPIVTADTLYVVEQPGEAGAATFALERGNGEPSPRWCSYIGSGAITAATDDLAVGSASLDEGPSSEEAVLGYSSSLGDSLWAITGGGNPREWLTSPAIVDGAIVVTTKGGTVVAVDEGA